MLSCLPIVALAAFAQDNETAAPAQLDEVVVVGRRGAARLAPERELGAEEIDNLGAFDIGEVINRISENLGLPQPPLVIVNGRQVVDPRNFLGFPPDALSRLEILPQQAGATYGADPTRRVVNIVLVPEFRSRDGLARASRPTGGGTSTLAVDARQSQLKETDTLQFGVEAGRTTSLRADERPDVLRDNPAREGGTLRPATRNVSANLSMTGTIGDWATSLTASAQDQRNRFSSRVGGVALDTRQATSILNASGGVSGSAYGWSVRLGLDAVAIESRQKGISDLTSRDLSGVANLSADRTLIDLPAGPMLMTVDAQYFRARSETDAEDASVVQSSQALEMRSGLTLPIWSAQQERGGVWGDLLVTLGGRLRSLDTASADGQGLNAGFAWTPSSRYRFTGQWSRATDAPSRDQRFAPVFYGAPQTVYDFRSAEAVEILPLTGGNPELQAQETQSASVGASAGPFGRWGLQGNLDLQSTRSTDAIGALPALTPATEAAFPDRFSRDAAGRLFAVDQRAINLKEIASDTLSSGLTANIPLGQTAPGHRRGSVQVSVSHTWRLADRLIIREDLPRFDRLAGDGGGVSRHQLTLRMDGRFGRWGANLNAAWRSSARIRRDVGQDGPQDLLLSPVTTVGLKLNTVLEPKGSETTQPPDRRRNDGLRLDLEIEILFDTRPGARLGDGVPAPGYGRNDQDPLGRTVRLTASRRF